MTEAPTLIRLDQLTPAPDNLRQKIDGTQVNELAASMTTHGLLQPLLIRPVARGKAYEIVAGHRRAKAAAKLGWEAVPCQVRELTEAERTEIMLIENLQRVDLNPVEEARGYFRIVEMGMTIKELAHRVGRTQKHVAGRLALLEAPPWALMDLADGKTTLENVDALAAADPALKEWLASLTEDHLAEVDQAAQEAWDRGGARATINAWQTAQADAKAAELVATARGKAADAGFPLVEMERDQYGQLKWPAKHAVLEELNITPKEHRKEPCHAIGLLADWSGRPTKAVELCTNRSRHTAKGQSPVKPADIDERVAQRETEKLQREQARAQEQRHLATIQAVVEGAKRSELVDLIVWHVCEQACSQNDETVKATLSSLGVDWKAEQLGSASERRERLAELAGSSKAAALRVAASSAIRAHHPWGAPELGREELAGELMQAFAPVATAEEGS